jgi:hypothetical protein
MKMESKTVKNKFHPLKSGEVICVANPVQFVSPNNTFRVSELVEALKQELIKYSSYGVSEEDLGWLSLEGSDCAVLQFGTPGWKKGKLRFKVEFCPDESETGYTSYENEEEEEATVVTSKSTNTGQVQPQSMTSANYASNKNNPFDDASSDLESDDFSLEPDLDFIAESATILEYSKPAGLASPNLMATKDEDEALDAAILSQSLDNELRDDEDDPFGDSDDAHFPEPLDDDENFGFDELGLDDSSINKNGSDFDSVWQDL